jgi:hypothetical protein
LKRNSLVPSVHDLLSEMHELCGPALLLKSEEKAHYDRVARAVIGAVKPKDAIELIWTADVIYHIFDIIRLRRMKIGLMEAAREEDSLEDADGEDGDDEMGAQIGGDADDEMPAQIGDDAAGAKEEARYLISCLGDYTAVDRLLSVAEVRKAGILHQIDMRRANFADRLRTISADVIEDKVGGGETTSEPRLSIARGERRRGSNNRLELHSPKGRKRKAG